MRHWPLVLLISIALLSWGCPGNDDDFAGDDDAGDDDAGDDDSGDDDGQDDDTGDDDTGDDDTGDDDTGDDDTGDDDLGDDDTAIPDPGLVPSPAKLVFGVVFLDSSQQLTLTLDEAGGGAVQITGTMLDGPAAAMYQADDLSGITVPQGGSVQADITYHPTSLGIHNAQFVIESDGLPGTLIVPIAGVSQEDPDTVDNDNDGYTEDQGDCDDSDASIHPGATEACNGVDDDCDGAVPANETTDSDGDGYPLCGDCNDFDADLEYDDADGDGVSTCDGDCDDGDIAVHPGAMELCDGVDTDCDGVTPPEETTDGDGDGYLQCEDCDDGNAAINPGATEICNGGIDDDCKPNTDELADVDSDGYSICDGDCDDIDLLIHPGATDPPNDGIDWDCDGSD